VYQSMEACMQGSTVTAQGVIRDLLCGDNITVITLENNIQSIFTDGFLALKAKVSPFQQRNIYFVAQFSKRAKKARTPQVLALALEYAQLQWSKAKLRYSMRKNEPESTGYTQRSAFDVMGKFVCRRFQNKNSAAECCDNFADAWKTVDIDDKESIEFEIAVEAVNETLQKHVNSYKSSFSNQHKLNNQNSLIFKAKTTVAKTILITSLKNEKDKATKAAKQGGRYGQATWRQRPPRKQTARKQKIRPRRRHSHKTSACRRRTRQRKR
jgi:hypothetical protein